MATALPVRLVVLVLTGGREGGVVPRARRPVLVRVRRLDRPALPPGEVAKLKLPPFRMLRLVAGVAPVGTARARLPEMEAVGVPVLTLRKANLAEAEAEAPIKRS